MVTTPVPALISALPLAPWAPAGAVRNAESIPKHNQPRAFLSVLSTTIVHPPNRKSSAPTLLFVAGIRARDHWGGLPRPQDDGRPTRFRHSGSGWRLVSRPRPESALQPRL